MKTIMKWFFAVVVLVVIVYLLVFALPTNSIMAEARQIFSGQKIVDTDHPLWRYSYKEEYFPETVTIQYSLSRIFVWHNGKTGYIKILYSMRYLDENNDVVSSSSGIPATWHIAKEGNKWVVTKVVEDP